LQDSEGRALYLNRDVLCPGEDKSIQSGFKKLTDLGDFIGMVSYYYQSWCAMYRVDEFLLSKTLRPLPYQK
jgi:hypothetical protein